MAKITPIKVPVEIVVDDAQLAKLREAATLRGSKSGGFTGSGVRSASRTGGFGGRPPIIDPDAVIAANTDAVVAGDPFAAARVNAAMAQKRAQKRAVDAVSPPSRKDAFMRTRWTSVAGKLVGSPLGRDLFAMAGAMGSVPGQTGGGASGFGMPEGASAIGVAAAAFTVAALALKTSIDNMRKGLDAKVRYGGTVGTALATSLTAESLGSAGPSNLQSASGLKAALFARAGVSPLRGFFGSINDTGDYIKMAKYVSTLSPEEARRYALGVGDPGLAKFAEMSPEMSRAVISGMSRPGGSSRDAADWEGRVTIAKQQFASDFANPAAAFHTALGTAGRTIPGPLGAIFSLIDAMPSGGVAGQSPADKIDKAADKMIEAAQRMNPGYFGNAAGSARKAFPGHFNPMLDPQGLNSIGRPLF